MKNLKNEPEMGKDCYVHPKALIIGNVKTGDHCSFWPGSVARGDEELIIMGSRTNLQDGAIIHVDTDFPTSIGNNVTIGHGAIVHGCTIEDNCIIGIRSTILNGSIIGRGSIVGAGAVVTPGTVIPPNSLVLGMPAKVKKNDPEIEKMALRNADVYVDIAEEHARGSFVEYRP